MNEKEKEMLLMLKEASIFILDNSHKWEEKFKGKYETRFKAEMINGNPYIYGGSGDSVKMYKKINNLIVKLKEDK